MTGAGEGEGAEIERGLPLPEPELDAKSDPAGFGPIKNATFDILLEKVDIQHHSHSVIIGEAARGSESVFCNFRQRHSRNSSDSRFRAKRCVSDEISKASDLDVGDSSQGSDFEPLHCN